MVIVGGGVIGVEFAQMYASMGTKVTIIQREDRLLPGIDKEIVDEFAKILKTESKIEVIYGATSTKLEGDENLIYTKDGKEEKITAEVILIATGRVPASEGLAEVGIELGARREVKVDKFLRTNVKGVYAIGDVTNQNMLGSCCLHSRCYSCAPHFRFIWNSIWFNYKTSACMYLHKPWNCYSWFNWRTSLKNKDWTFLYLNTSLQP